ncbi:MAG: hypothetical protein A2514_13170 [Gammaproteobacteria bacterium RIFOXYD12_FULL_61_37]|nr:MAG: hypothetical protein A2514_13170 [Gammaproteobacteria bacterium RIFOXYD12_FULL_61_37]
MAASLLLSCAVGCILFCPGSGFCFRLAASLLLSCAVGCILFCPGGGFCFRLAASLFLSGTAGCLLLCPGCGFSLCLSTRFLFGSSLRSRLSLWVCSTHRCLFSFRQQSQWKDGRGNRRIPHRTCQYRQGEEKG